MLCAQQVALFILWKEETMLFAGTENCMLIKKYK